MVRFVSRVGFSNKVLASLYSTLVLWHAWWMKSMSCWQRWLTLSYFFAIDAAVQHVKHSIQSSRIGRLKHAWLQAHSILLLHSGGSLAHQQDTIYQQLLHCSSFRHAFYSASQTTRLDHNNKPDSLTDLQHHSMYPSWVSCHVMIALYFRL